MALAVANSWKNTQAGANPIAVTVSGFSAGDLCIVLGFGFENTSGNTFNFSDNVGNTYTKIAESTQDGTTFRSWSALGYSVVSTPPTSVRAPLAAGGGLDSSICVLRVTGAATSSVTTGTASGKTQTAQNPTTNSITTTDADAIIIVGCAHDAGDTTLTSPTSFTQAQENESNSVQAFHAAYRIVASTGTYTPQFTTGASRDFGMVIGAFKAAAGGGTTYDQSISATSTGSVAFTKSAGKKFNVTATGSASYVKSVGKSISRTATGAASVIKGATKSFAVSSSGTAALQKTAGKSISAEGSGSASFVKSAGKRISASATGSVNLVRSVSKSFAAAATGTASVVKSVTKSFAVTAIGTLALSAMRVYLVTIAATATGTAVFTRSVGKLLNVSGSATTALARQIGKTVAATSLVEASLSKAVSKTWAATATGSASFTKSVRKTIGATATGAVTIGKQALGTVIGAFLSIGDAVKTRLGLGHSTATYLSISDAPKTDVEVDE